MNAKEKFNKIMAVKSNRSFILYVYIQISIPLLYYKFKQNSMWFNLTTQTKYRYWFLSTIKK